jgi:TonB family protein
LIKSSVWLTGFALVYLVFLRNERFFTLNRIFLVSGILISVIFPFFTWHYTVLLPVVPSIEISDPQVQGIVVTEEPLFTTQNALLFLYLSGIIYLVFRMIRQTLPVFRIIRKSETSQYSSVKLIRYSEYPASFSFFSFVFVNPSISDTETREIVNHELEHIRQKHWIDLLLFEILCMAQWFNPVVWLYGHLIRQNHEYLADEQALQRSSNPAVYRAALLNQMFGGPVISLANSFNYSLNKKRFNMMKQTISSPIRKLKLLMVLPLIAGVFYAFSAPEYKFVQAEELENNLTQSEKTVKGKVLDENGNPLKNASIIISGKTIGTITDSNGNFTLKVTDDSPLFISYVGFDSQKVAPDFDKEMAITMKRKTIFLEFDNQVSVTGKKEQINTNESKALVIVDGKEISKADLDKIQPDNVESVSVLKAESATKLYGEKGKNGVVLVTMKKGKFIDGKNNVTKLTGNFVLNSTQDTSSASPGLQLSANEMHGEYQDGTTILKADTIKLDFAKTNSQILINGLTTTKAEVNQLNPDNIESIDIMKGESATRLYGEKGKNGVILITMKKSPSTEFSAKEIESKNNEGVILKEDVKINIKSENDKQPLIVIDGVIAENQNLDKIDPETIESVTVIKNKESTEKYGKKGKNGVLEIKMKPKTGVFTMVEEMPQFPGGNDALKTFVYSTMKYPATALEKGIVGQVFVNFLVEKTGAITNVKISRGVEPSLDKEAIRIVESMPKWNPGKQNGETVDAAYEIPINFTLPSDYHPKNRLKLEKMKKQ